MQPSSSAERDRLQAKCDWYNSRRMPPRYGFDCPKCHNTGIYYFVKEYESANGNTSYEICAVRCKCQARAEARSFALSNGTDLSPAIGQFEASEPWQKDAKARLEEYMAKAREGEKGLWFAAFGKPGTGKTLMAGIATAYFVNELEAKAATIVWPSWVNAYKSGLVSDNPGDQYGVMDQICRVPVLLVDEVMKCPTEADMRYLAILLERRYADDRSGTLVTGEDTALEAMKSEWPSLFGRVYERAGNGRYFVTVPKWAKDYRTLGKEKKRQ